MIVPDIAVGAVLWTESVCRAIDMKQRIGIRHCRGRQIGRSVVALIRFDRFRLISAEVPVTPCRSCCERKV